MAKRVKIEDEPTHQVVDHKIELAQPAVAAELPKKIYPVPDWKSTFVASQTAPFALVLADVLPQLQQAVH